MKKALFAFVLSLFFVGTAMGMAHETKGADIKENDTGSAVKDTDGKHEVVSINRLMGNRVENNRNEVLGEIANVLFDPQTGQVAYVLLNTGGFFSGESKVVPYKALKVTDDMIILDIDKQKLANAPSLEGEQSFQDFDRQSAEFFGVGPLWVE